MEGFWSLTYPPWLPLGLEPNPWVDLSPPFMVCTSTPFSPLEIGQWLPSVQSLSQLFATHGLLHTRLPCASATHEPWWNSCPSSLWCHPTISSSSLQSFPASRSFLMSQCIRWPKYWSFSFSISPSNEQSSLISFRIDWSDLLALQGILKSPLQHSSKALILRHSAFFIVQLSHPKKQESSRKTSISALLSMPKPLTVWITINWKILQELGIPDHLICLLRNLYAGQEATVRT